MLHRRSQAAPLSRLLPASCPAPSRRARSAVSWRGVPEVTWQWAGLRAQAQIVRVRISWPQGAIWLRLGLCLPPRSRRRWRHSHSHGQSVAGHPAAAPSGETGRREGVRGPQAWVWGWGSPAWCESRDCGSAARGGRCIRTEKLRTGRGRGMVTVGEACVTRSSQDPNLWKSCRSPESCDVG